MEEPSPRTSRLAIAGSLAALLAAGGGGFLLGRESAPTPPPAVSAPPAPAPSPVAAEEKKPEERVLTRADLIAIGRAGADAAASGLAVAPPVEVAAGQRFELYLPFGCDGPSPEGSSAALQWRYQDPTLRVRVTPTRWDPADWWPAAPETVEGLEGFWIARPWSSAETCTPSGGGPVGGSAPAVPPAETLGVAQLVTEDMPRQLRRDGKPYESVTRVPPEALRIGQGLRLRLRGRLAQFAEGQVARCTQPGGREQRPVCLIAVTIDEVAVENPATKEDLATWSPTVASSASPGG